MGPSHSPHATPPIMAEIGPSVAPLLAEIGPILGPIMFEVQPTCLRMICIWNMRRLRLNIVPLRAHSCYVFGQQISMRSKPASSKPCPSQPASQPAIVHVLLAKTPGLGTNCGSAASSRNNIGVEAWHWPGQRARVICTGRTIVIHGHCQSGKSHEMCLCYWLAYFIYETLPYVFVMNHGGLGILPQMRGAFKAFHKNVDTIVQEFFFANCGMPASQPASQPASSQPQPDSQPACQAASQPASLPASQAAIQPASQPASQPAGCFLVVFWLFYGCFLVVFVCCWLMLDVPSRMCK
jgi:hypothetical protein